MKLTKKTTLESAVDKIAFNYVERGRLTTTETKKLRRIITVVPKLKTNFSAYIKVASIGAAIRQPAIPADVSARLRTRLQDRFGAMA